MNQNPRAWLLSDGAGNPFAVSEVEMVAYEQSAHGYRVPASPDYCSEVILWQQRLIPLVHLSWLFEPYGHRGNAHVGIVAYQTCAGAPLDYLALSLGGAPVKIEVKENTLAPLPARYELDPLLRALAISCFSHGSANIPILDLAYLASTTLRDGLQARAAKR